MKFISWDADMSAEFENATGEPVKADLPKVEHAYWATMNKDEPLKEGVLAGIRFDEAKKARNEFKGQTL